MLKLSTKIIAQVGTLNTPDAPNFSEERDNKSRKTPKSGSKGSVSLKQRPPLDTKRGDSNFQLLRSNCLKEGMGERA